MKMILILMISVCVIQYKLPKVVCEEDFTEYVTLDTTATLPCGSIDKTFPTDAFLLYWYRGDNPVTSQSIVRFTESTGDVAYPNGDSPDKYEYNIDTRALKIKDIEYDDEMVYSCGQLGSSTPFSYIVRLIVPVPPSQPSLTLPNFQENTATSIQCRVSAVKPGVGSVVFTVTVDPDFSIQSSDSDLSEGSADVTTGAVSVTYSPQISLQRKHNGQQALCTVVWRDGKKTVTSEIKTVDVIFTATSITMQQSPRGLVSKNTEITFTCLTDEANPTASVTWTVDRDGRSSTTDSTVDGNNYNALKRESGLTLTADRTLHNRKVKCVISGNTGIAAEETLNIAYVSPPLTLSLLPATSNLVQAGTSVTFTCTLDANPAPSFSIWTSNGQSQKWAELDTNKNSITLSLQKQHNKVNMFCRGDGSLSGYPVNSDFKSYTVQFSASTMTMTQSPSGLVSENKEVTFTCVTDEAEPTADVVWSVDGNTRSSDSDSTVEGMYNTQKRRSVLKVTVDKPLNNKKVECYVSGKSAVRDSVRLGVTFPHNVHVSATPSDTVSQGSSLTLICEATGGNPAEVVSYNWIFEPRYEVSSELSNKTRRELEFDDVQYTQAGVYRCEADNGAGFGHDEKDVLVQFSPVDVSSDSPKVSYSPINHDATLNCTVRANPVVTQSDVTIRHNNVLVSSDVSVQVVDTKTDKTAVALNFQPVQAEDYGTYEVVVKNKLGQQTIRLILVENGLPGSPHSVALHSITAVSITLSWLPGRSGGSAQTFTVYYRKDGEGKILYQDGIEAVEDNKLIVYKVPGLDPETKYYFKVQAKNSWGERISLLEIPGLTLARPELKDVPSLRLYDDIGVLQWSNVNGIHNYTAILECTSVCTTVFNYTENSHRSLVLSENYQDKSYFILVYQSEDEVLRQKFGVEDRGCSVEQVAGLIAGIAITSVVVGLLFITLIVLYMFLKNGKCNKYFTRQSKKGTEEQPTASYENVVNKQGAGHYELTRPEEPQLPAEYTDLKNITYEVVG